MDCDNKEEWSNAEYRIVNKGKCSNGEYGIK